MKVSIYRSSPDAFFVNSYIAELDNVVVVVDTQFVLPEAGKLVQAVEAIGKPVGAVFLTHPHPDHVNGTQLLLDRWPGAPVYATEATRAAIVELAGPKRAQWKPLLGDAYPDEVVEPTHIVNGNETVTIDSVDFRFYDVGALEAINESIIEVPGEQVAFVGDLFYNRVHPWLVEGRALAWRDALESLSPRFAPFKTLYAGHGDPGSPASLGEQAQYMDRFFALVRGLAEGGSPDGLVEQMKREYPGWPLEMLIGMNIGPVRAELAGA